MPFPTSKRIFDTLKDLYDIKNFELLLISVENNLIKIENPELIFSFIEILNIESYFQSIVTDYKLLYTNESLSFEANEVKKHTKIYKKSDHLQHLCNIHFSEKKILFIPEYILDKDKIIKSDNSFLFIYKSTKNYYLIWESIVEDKATYIFRTNKESLDIDRYNLFIYLASKKMKNKRDNLIHSMALKTQYKLSERIMHDKSDVISWKEKISFILDKFSIIKTMS